MKDLNSTEMKLLQYLGKNPELTNKELASMLGLKNFPYVSSLKSALEEKQYCVGPYYQTDYSRIFKNRVRKAVAFVLFEQSYQFMLQLLKKIECFSYVYPIEERFFRSYMAGIFDSDTGAIKKIFDYLKREGIIFHYELYLQEGHTCVIPPMFLVDSEEATFVPPLDNLLQETEVTDLSYGPFEGISLSLPEQLLVSSFEQGVHVLTQIMEEKRTDGAFFTYAEWKAAKDRLVSHQVVQPVYDVFPLPTMDCSHFFLFVHTESISDMQKVLFNFGENSRLHKKVFLWTSYETQTTYGVIYCISHPLFTIKLLRQLDMYEEIIDKKFFVLRKEFSYWEGKSISMEYYDPVSCTLRYPYKEYLEKIKTFVEETPW